MQELAIVVLILGGVALMQFLAARLSPEALVSFVLVTLNIINFFIALINVIQAKQRHKRVLPAMTLGHITLATGILLLAVAGFFWGWNAYTGWISLPFIASGFITYLAVGIFSSLKRRDADGRK